VQSGLRAAAAGFGDDPFLVTYEFTVDDS